MAKATKSSIPEYPGEGNLLCVRNVTAETLGFVAAKFRPLDDFFPTEFVLNPHQEILLSPGWEKQGRLQNAVEAGKLRATWVASDYVPSSVPTPSEAPEDAQPEDPRDRAYAMNIITVTDEKTVLGLVQARVDDPQTGELDTRFYKTRMLRILKFVRWAEPQVQNRRNILRAVKERIGEIQEM